ncbi:MAG: sulfatase-like hydrolase/transferase [Planctomycetaceae bacterium]
MRHRICWLILFATLATPQLKAKPNVVFIYTDDQAPFAVNAAGDSRFITPNIDQIFHEGAHLKNSFVTTPVCSPSRVGLITSRYGSEFSITDWINPGNEKEIGLPKDALTFPTLFQKAGYRTALFGKWHLGIQNHQHPTRFGYDQFAGIRVGGCPPKDPTMETLDGEMKKVLGYTCDIFTDHALEFIQANKDKPFLLSLHFRAPHAAWLPVRPEDWEPFKDLDPEIPNPEFPNLNVSRVKKQTRESLASVKSVDRNVGRVLDLLESLQLGDNTIVIFTSDHGYNLGEHGVWYKGNAIRILTENPQKRWEHIPPSRRPNLWDTSLRVPTAIRWPGTIRPGTVHNETFSNLDWFPTLLGMANIKTPKSATLRGEDFSPVLQGRLRNWDSNIYLEYSMHHGAKTHMRGIRTPEWKFMVDFANPGRRELYRLTDDPQELENLAYKTEGETQDVMTELMNSVVLHMEQIKDPLIDELKPQVKNDSK